MSEPQLIDRLNLHLVNQIAKRHLLKLKVKPDPDMLYIYQLMEWALDNQVPLQAGRWKDYEMESYDLRILLDILICRTDPQQALDVLIKEDPIEGVKWINPRVLAKLKPEAAAEYALQQLQSLKLSREPGLDE